MNTLVRWVGRIVGAAIGGGLGVAIARVVIAGDLQEASGGLLIGLTALFGALVVGGGWLGGKMAFDPPPPDPSPGPRGKIFSDDRDGHGRV
jgi:hypothetical protein